MLLSLSPLVTFSDGVVVVFVSVVQYYQREGIWGVAVKSFVHFASADQSGDSCVLR
jgi:hypothetical protein